MNAAVQPELLQTFLGRREIIADAWYTAIARTSFTPLTAPEARQKLATLTEQAIGALLAEPFDRRGAQAVGAALARLHYLQPAALGGTLEVLGHKLVEDLPADEAAALQRRLAMLLGELAAGFFGRARTMILDEQEEIRNALFVARRQAEAALLESEERLRTVVANVPVVLFALDREGVFTLLEGKGLEAIQQNPDETVGRSIFEVFHDGQALLAGVQRALAGESFSGITEVAGVVFETSCSPLRDPNGEITGVIGVASDITERSRAEEERLAFEQLKSDFIANISHDLRTPLHHIRGYASLLLQHGSNLDEETQQEFLQTISDSSEQLARLIADLLDASRINKTGALTIEIETMQIDALVRSVVQRWQTISSHQFKAIIPDYVPPVAADGVRIGQVLDNLLTNIVRHTPENTSAEIEIQVEETELLISAIDHGPGVGAEHLLHLFERFYQVDPRRDGQRRGTGLGLFICKWIVEQHGGRIWAEPTPGGGLTIRFTLPRPPAVEFV
ncbi:MAG TPA: ATP-binding protein [Herpetosiphonaceae bacterium]|nr:ATP-binding protein [Herpetosiphonaceae bacterium]